MAHNIISKTSDVILSGAFPTIDIEVDGEFVDVVFAHGIYEILSTRYYAYQGKVSIYKLAETLGVYLRHNNLSYAEFSLKAFTDTEHNLADSCIFKVLHCDRYVPNSSTDYFLADNFLTTLPHRRIGANTPSRLYFFARAAESIEYSVDYVATIPETEQTVRGRFVFDSGASAPSDGVYSFLVIPADIVSRIRQAHDLRNFDVVELNTLTMTCKNRVFSAMVDPELNEFAPFAFRNCFNVWDVAVFPGVTTAKTSVERKELPVAHVATQSDRQMSKAYTTELGPMIPKEADWFEQVLTSMEVYRFEHDETNGSDGADYYLRVIIEDGTFDSVDRPTDPVSVKFTWHYAYLEPFMQLVSSPGIFKNPYNPIFS